ncbi:hypothetical protein VitviT2T_023075 [Vitis vinifera]|uniref:Ubiquitin-like protease family profile domain-containing protein n=1 Tax=Vitis vinifera TaxID=29760 RepID=A0ABY9DCH0_VITVI|nr:hypothetical protein VitviT2T_023075 [Vitis vinifera]
MKSQQCRIRSKGSKQDGLQTSWVSKIDEGIELVLENGYEDLEREVGRWMWRIHDAREMEWCRERQCLEMEKRGKPWLGALVVVSLLFQNLRVSLVWLLCSNFKEKESGERNVWALVNWDNESFISVRGLKWSAPIGKQQFVRKCQLAIGTKENVVAAGTIILECGVNFLVVVDASYEPNAPLPVPIPNQIKTIGEALGYQVLWPAQMVSLTTHPIQDSKKFKKQRNKETRLSSKDENPIDIKNFATLVGLLLKEGKVHAVNITKDVFGESCKSFLMNDDMDMIISSTEVSSNCLMFYIWHLHKKMVDAKMAGRFAFVNPALVSKAGMGEASKESRSRVIANRLMNANHADFIFIPYNPSYHWVLVALETRTMIAYYLDSLEDQPSDDLKEIVNM